MSALQHCTESSTFDKDLFCETPTEQLFMQNKIYEDIMSQSIFTIFWNSFPNISFLLCCQMDFRFYNFGQQAALTLDVSSFPYSDMVSI